MENQYRCAAGHEPGMTALAHESCPDRKGSDLLRFLMVGGLAAIAYSMVTAALVSWSAQPPALISGLVWVAFIPPVFWCHRRFTFRTQRPRKHALWLYALTQGLSLMIVSAAGALFVSQQIWLDTMVYLLASVLAAMTSFALNRTIVFALI